MSGISASLTKWFSERFQWLQIAATRLLQQSELTDKDVSELATLCQQEADGKLPKTTCSFPASAFSQSAERMLTTSGLMVFFSEKCLIVPSKDRR